MAMAVITVASGGLPVVDVTASTPKLGLPVTEALAGRGMAVTKVAARGMPVTYSTVADYPPPSGGTSAEATAFLARTSGLDATHTNAYTALIDGLVADGIWAKLDVLYIYATDTSVNAVLNLVSTNYNGTISGSPTFTADRGFTGTDSNTLNFINPGFNPTTAPSPKSVLNSAHISLWTNATISGNGSGIVATQCAFIAPNHNSGAFYSRINSANAGGTFSASAAAGHYLGSRTGVSAIAGYKNGSSVMTDTQASTSLPNFNYVSLGYNNSGAGTVGSSQQHAMFSIGSGLNSTEAGNFYARLRTYMTVVGVP